MPEQTDTALASDRDLKAASHLLTVIAERGSASRAELADATGWARSTVSQWIERLQDIGLVREGDAAPSTGGRRAVPLHLEPTGGLLLTASFGATHARLVVSDLGGRPLQELTTAVRLHEGPERVLATTYEQFSQLIGSAHESLDHVRAITIGLPGPVDYPRGCVVRPPIMPGWDGYPVREDITRRFATQVEVDNDVNLMAWGTHQARFRDVDHLLFVKVGTGIGCGLVLNGTLHRGADGCAGDIGHVPVPDSNELCHCGRIGCLEAVASAAAIARHLGLGSVAELAAQVNNGEPPAVHAIRRAGQQIGQVLAGLVSFVNPDVIVLAGSLAQLKELLLTEIRSAVIGQALDLATRTLRFDPSPPDTDVATLGAVALAQRQALSPASLARLVDQRGVG